MSLVVLNDDLLIAQGGERSCYIHPNNENRIIKVIHKEDSHNNQNELEWDYYKYLQSQSITYEHITECYGFEETNLGSGLVFDRVTNYDGSLCRSLRYLMVHKEISIKEQERVIEQLRVYLEKHRILFVDTSLTNILCPKINENEYKLIIVDGLGAKRFGLKYWLYRNVSFYYRYKMYKQWQKFMKNYKSDVHRIRTGTNPIKRV